jgi:hypothetical protein
MLYKFWKRTRAVNATIFLIFAQIWTLMGSIPTLISKSNSYDTVVNPLEQLLYPINDKSIYLISILLYTLFLLLLLTLCAIFYKATTARPEVNCQTMLKCQVSQSRLILFLIIALAILISRASILQSTLGNRSIYQYNFNISRVDTYLIVLCVIGILAGAYFSAWQESSQFKFILVYLFLSLALFFVLNLVGRRLLGYTLALGFIFIFLDLARNGKISRRLQAQWLALASVVFYFVSATTLTRGKAFGGDVIAQIQEITRILVSPSRVLEQIANTLEIYSAHFSLYGLLKNQEILFSPGAKPSYQLWADLVSAPSTQGFTIHPVTAWSLYLGPMGFIAAAVFCFALIYFFDHIGKRFNRFEIGLGSFVCYVVAPASLSFLALRSGPDGIWGVFLINIVAPFIIVRLFRKQRSTSRFVSRPSNEH